MANQLAGKASSDIPALKPYRGKPAVRNFRGGKGNVGIIRSPVRAIALPDHLILFGEASLRKALTQFLEHYHAERNHQGKDNVLLFPAPARLEPGWRRGIRCRECLGGLLRYYSRAA